MDPGFCDRQTWASAMKVGVIGPTDPDSFADNVESALVSMGHEAVSLGPAIPRGQSSLAIGTLTMLSRFVSFAEAFQRRIVATAGHQKLQAVISLQEDVLPATVYALKRHGSKVAMWFPDHIANLGRQLMLAADYDAVFFKDPLLVERLQGLTNAPVHYLPEACNPAWHRPSPRDDVRPVVVMAGNLHPARVLLLERLNKAGVPLVLHSSGYPRWLKSHRLTAAPVLPPIFRAEKARVFRTAAAVLNNLHPAEMDGANCRLFEAAGSGAVVLTEDRPVLGDLFERQREVLAFSTFDELMDQISLVLNDTERGTVIGDAAALRAHAEHTYQHRLFELFTVLGLNPTLPTSRPT